MTTNLSTLEMNVIHAFQAYYVTDDQLDDAEAMFLRYGSDMAAERDVLRALELWDRTKQVLEVSAAVVQDNGIPSANEAIPSLTAFIRDTHYRYEHPGRRNTPWKHWREY